MNFLTSVKKTSFKQKLLVYSFFIGIIPIFFFVLISSHILMENLNEDVEHSHEMTLEQIQFRIDLFIENLQLSSVYLASNEVLIQSTEAGSYFENPSLSLKMIEMIRRHMLISPSEFATNVIYPKYDYFYSSHDKSTTFTNSIYSTILQQVQPKYNAPFFVTPHTFQNQGDLMLFRPIPTHSYYTEGILVLNVSINTLMEYIDQLDLGYNSEIYVVDGTGRIVISQNIETIGSQIYSDPELYQFWVNSEGFQDVYYLNGVEYKLSAQKSTMNDWTYITRTPKNALTKRMNEIKKIIWLTTGAVTIIWLYFSFLISRHLYSPIHRLLSKFSLETKQQGTHSDGLKQIDIYMNQMINNNKQLKDKLDESLPYIKENVYRQLLWGELSDSQILNKIDLPLKSSWYYVCVIAVDEYESFIDNYQGLDRSLIHSQLRKLMVKMVGEKMPCITIVPQVGQAVAVIGREEIDDTTDQTLFELANAFRSNIKKNFNFTVSVSISQPRRGYANINTSYRNALSLFNYRILLGHDNTISHQNIESSTSQPGRKIIEFQKNVVVNVLRGNLQRANQQLERLIDETQHFMLNMETVIACFANLIGELDYHLYEMGYELNDFFDYDLYKHFHSLDTLEKVNDWYINEVFPAIEEQLNNLNLPRDKVLIQNVLIYIHDNYDKDLSLQLIADQFEVSPSYLSRLFKADKETHFSEYVIQYRMNKAKEWLQHSSISIKEIAEKLRYTSVQGFSRTFKQVEGIPPGEYRKKFR